MQSTWVSSFQRVNLHPGTRVAFPEFCKKIAGFLRASESFKDESVDPKPKEKFALLPLFWHAMQPLDMKVVMTIVGSHGFHYALFGVPSCIRSDEQHSCLRNCDTRASETVEFNIPELGSACSVATMPF